MSTASTAVGYTAPSRTSTWSRLGKTLGTAILLALLLNIVVSTWGAQHLAAKIGGWPTMLGEPMFYAGGLPVMSPLAWTKWLAWLKVPALKNVVTGIATVACIGWMLAFKMVKPFFDYAKYKEAAVHGSAHWATREEIEKTGLLEKE